MMLANFSSLITTLKSGALWRYAAGLGVRGVETIGKLGLYVAVGARLGAHDAGLFFLCLTWIGIVSTVARLGFDRAMTRHIAAELAVGNGRAARAALVQGLALTTLASVAAALLTVLVADLAAVRLFGFPDLAWPLYLSALVLVPQTLAFSLGAALAGFGRGVAAQVVQNALWPVVTLAALLALPIAVEGVIVALGAALAASCLLGGAILLRERGRLRTIPAQPAAEALPSLWATARPLLVVEITQVGLSGLPVFVLGMVADAATVGAFSIASRISMLIWVIIISIGTLAAPRYAALYRLGDSDGLRAYNRLVQRGAALVAVPATLVMLAVPEFLLGLISADFRIAALALQILALGQMANGLFSCQDILLAMAGKGDVLRRLNLLQLAVGLVLCGLLIPAFGLTGAALAASLTVLQGALGTHWAARRHVLSIGRN
ncbi:MATE family efflux transporter [Oceanibaculum sp.]|uniref:MATE family efflux transporter n=1 Tax=Oceanibaculum sp. TaxID=1903597 RepID=UPI002583EF1C|nr:MATE family efflux transporter [Oceanibaculum sp.]MCH2394954.1 oligosaccharide flippase family protein [Oceanibaculum sp.]